MGAVLRERLGEAASKAPARTVPDLLVRATALFDPDIRSVIGGPGNRTVVGEGEGDARLGTSLDRGHDRETGESLIRQAASATA
jgi:hypothetical protein